MRHNVRNIFALTLLMLMTPLAASAVTINSFAEMLQNLNTNIPMVKQLVVGFCYVFGIAMIMRAVFMFKRYGEMRTMMANSISMQKPAIVLFIGCGLYFLPTLINHSIESLYAYGSSSVMEYPAATSWSAVINPLIQIVKLLGLVVFIKGWILLGRYGGEGGNQPGTGGKAVMHMVGGILAMNIVATMDIITASFGL